MLFEGLLPREIGIAARVSLILRERCQPDSCGQRRICSGISLIAFLL